MKHLLIILLLILVVAGCSLNKTAEPEIQKLEPMNENAVIDSLYKVISYKDQKLDSLYLQLQNYDFIIDSLEIELDISNSRVAVNQNFHIPDSLVFADRVFDLTNERLYNKFEKIFKHELRSAHKFIPRSGKYFAIFDSIFTEYKIPLDVKYLAIAESQLTPMATSHVGAAGIWQFMPSTAKGFKMRIDSFVDERRDVFFSTKAAAQYLLNSHDYLKNRGAEDWLLTMCAYNAGAGSIAKVIRQQEVYDFFDILMNADETQQYVWRAAAIKLIFDNEQALFGKILERQKPLLDENHLVEVKLKGHYKIDDWAKAQGTSLGRILELNPWIKIYKQSRRKYSAVNNVVLPPGDYEILIPNNGVVDEKALAALEKQFLNENTGFFTHHIVKRGDTLYDIARKYKTTISKIKGLNGLRSNVIYPGQKLKLYGNQTKTQGSRNYIVKKGDTVGEIADKLGVTSKWIITNNNLKNNNGIVIIRPGQKLYY
ncbi:MAG: LysM peptidoglycan-binding domain-containing protein [Candidatus Cloacimonetes bacterium]|nr:LysM peptidoglycan-binding domain-containing protein [Candidatus Cloacimonadota bacterium]MCF7814467.1 LysM peptidoglycan-binding domain-containing protein [Candidatus Cloacimonadota bacterium]MCF7869042.1 LysM peptidoglycan-binding domain-containing protein [Candidatus Cloacimonadota bacterium]MCF7884437.1 LysM peptidoglycan-binding domain-containing protein [Candidatus Cloacimonadota bacterium]